MNLKMPDLKRCFEAAEFENVVTVISSGNVVFDAKTTSKSLLEHEIEEVMKLHLGRVFLPIVRRIDFLSDVIEGDPYKAFKLKAGSKRVITFLRTPARSKPSLPIERAGASILKVEDGLIYSAYMPNPKGPNLLQMIEKEFGKAVSTRTWETVAKVIKK